jgi:hypothetical protein
MAERSDLTTFWEESPRLIEIAIPSTEIIMQDLHDTLNSNTEQASHSDDSLDNMDDDPLIDSAGKENLGDGREVAITATLQNAQVMAESRLTPTEEGTITNGDTGGTLFEDNTALLITNGVTRGAVLINFSDQSVTEVLEVLTETTARTRVLRAGTLNQYTVSDVYKIWNVEQVNIGGGNLVAVDTDGVTPISPIFPTFCTQIVRTTSSSATALSQEDLLFAGAVWVDADDGSAGGSGSQQDPVLTVTQGLAVGATKSIKQYMVRGTLTFGSDPVPSDWQGFGGGAAMVLSVGSNFDKTFWKEVSIVGAVSGDMGMTAASVAAQFNRCGFTGDVFSNLHGFFTDCAFDGTTLRPVAAAPLVVDGDSTGQTAGSSPSLIIDGTAGAIDVSVRGFTAGVQVQNVTNASAVMTVSVNGGKITLDDSISAGTVVLRGNGLVDDQRTVFTATVINEVLDPIKLKEVHTVLGLEGGNKVTITPSGIDTELGDINIDFTGDGINTTTMDRQ